ncbi:hypothetical protein GCM10027414_11360 [Humibacter ginsengiterrae]
MDERRRLLERVFSREGAAEATEEHRDPATGETVRMTPSQWALAEYDRVHAREIQGGVDTRSADAEQVDASRRNAQGEIDARESSGDVGAGGARADIRSSDEASSVRNARSRRAERMRKALPYLAAAGAFVLGIALTLGVQAATVQRSHPGNTASSDAVESGGFPGPQPGEGDEGATLVAVTRYFANTPRVDDLPADTTRGYDPTSFHLVTGSVNTKDGNAVYAARRLDGAYCLVLVSDAGSAAATCGTLDDIARHGLSLTTEVASAIRTGTFAVTVNWATDGTISWKSGPFAD